MTHIILLFLVTAKDANFLDIAIKETTKNGIAEATGTSGYQKDFVFEY